jgi:2-dehydro-3-deoxygluconokinase
LHKVVRENLQTLLAAAEQGFAGADGQFFEVAQEDTEIFDRVGGGDSFASGFICGLLEGRGLEWAVRCGVAHGALAMATAGDTSMASRSEVERLMKGKSARISR